MPGSYASARIARGPEAGARPVRGGDVERRPDDRDVRLPAVELFRVGDQRPLAERADARRTRSRARAVPACQERANDPARPWPNTRGRNVAGKRVAPGGAACFRRRTHPGLPERWDDPPTGRSSGVSLRSTYTSPVVPEGMAGDARCGPVSGCPVPLPLAPPPVARRRCRPESVLSANRPPFPKLDSAPVARTSVLAPFTLTRLPVPTSDWRLRTEWFLGSSWGAPWTRPVPRCPWPPASRRLGTSKLVLIRSPLRLPGARRFCAAPPLAAPVARCSSLRSVASRPVRSRLRRVDSSRFPLPSAQGFVRRTRSSSPVWRALPGTSHTFANQKPQVKGYFPIPRVIPRTFSPIPRNLVFVHCSYTGMSPAVPSKSSPSLTDPPPYG